MKKLLTLLLCVFVLVWCTIKQQNTTSPDPKVGQNQQENTIDSLNLYQVILDGSELEFTGVKMLIGCNDSLVANSVKISIKESEKFLEVWKLLKSYDNESSWFLNPRKWQSAIEFDSYEIQGNKLIIKLSGLLRIAWTCEVPRLEESLKSTYKAFGFDEVELLVNGKKISEQ